MTISRICKQCKHLHREKSGYSCAAFPEGIPEAILTGGFSHYIRFPRQRNDTLFEDVAGTERVVIDAEFQIPVFSSICHLCANLINGRARSCQAFPEYDGIPFEIWAGKDPHVERHPDQGNDVLFETR